MQQLQQLPNERDSVEQEQMLSSSITGLQTAIRLEEADLRLTENALAILIDEVNALLPCHQACLSGLQQTVPAMLSRVSGAHQIIIAGPHAKVLCSILGFSLNRKIVFAVLLPVTSLRSGSADQDDDVTAGGGQWGHCSVALEVMLADHRG